jgi:hypothetical protein
MANRGRPKKDGVKPGWTLFRRCVVLHAYNEARAKGNKHSAAITEAVSAVRSRVAGMKISETKVKRVLAEFQKASPTDQSLPFGWTILNALLRLLGNPAGN